MTETPNPRRLRRPNAEAAATTEHLKPSPPYCRAVRNGQSPGSEDPGPATDVREGGVEPEDHHSRSRTNSRPERETEIPLPPVRSRYLGGVRPRGAPASVLQLRQHQVLDTYPMRMRLLQLGHRTNASGATPCKSPARPLPSRRSTHMRVSPHGQARTRFARRWSTR